jgi:hypothetical protein
MNQSTSPMKNETKKIQKHRAQILKEVVPVAGRKVHGVTFDGKLVWYASDDEMIGFDPAEERVSKRLPVAADAGTAWDGEHLYQLAADQIQVVDPATGRLLRTIPAPGKGRDSGLAFADGFLWVGQYRDKKIHKIDAKTGEVVKTLTSDRFVTGVTCVDGALWHGVSDDDGPSELRKLAVDGSVEEVIAFDDASIHVAGVESDGKGSFWCGGENGKLRLVRRAS